MNAKSEVHTAVFAEDPSLFGCDAFEEVSLNCVTEVPPYFETSGAVCSTTLRHTAEELNLQENATFVVL